MRFDDLQLRKNMGSLPTTPLQPTEILTRVVRVQPEDMCKQNINKYRAKSICMQENKQQRQAEA
jgi:hypothetical protein